ncbi:MAG: hypothetical protein FJY66_02955 [Calditrichaeota bacterium]|nr:hypothetical protein [Calditrichota bacterium]
MRERIHIFWEILLVVLVAAMVWIAISNLRIAHRIRHFHEQEQQVGIGSDKELVETVATLEADLIARLAYETRVKNNPLDLTRVIQSRKFLARLGIPESLEQMGRMRLSCTVVGTDGSAIIKFMGRSHIVHEGDTFNGYVVESINPQRVVLTKAGSRLILINEGAPKGEIGEKGKPEGNY